MSAHLDAIVDEVIAAHPLPSTPEGLDDSSRRDLERRAGHARMTPEALLALSRSRAKLSAGERFRAHQQDVRNLSAGRAMDDPGEQRRGDYDLDALVESLRNT